MILGMARGKVGELVFKRLNGEQITVPRVRNPKNPQSDAQTVRRLAFSSAVKLAQQLEPVISNSWQSRKYGQPSINYFVGEAAKIIGGYAMRAATGDYYGFAPIVPYNSMLGVCVPVRISEGTLSSGNIRPFNAPGSPVLSFQLSPLIPQGPETITVADFLGIFGVPVDTQITFVCGKVVPMPEYDTPTEVNGVGYSIGRLNFKTGLASDTVLFTLTSGQFELETSAVDATRSNITALTISGPSGSVGFAIDGVTVSGSFCSAAVIYSRYVDGEWRRSTSELKALIGVDSAIHAQSYYGWNDLAEIIDISRKSARAVTETEFLNKEPN